jgi:hypothetical protein
MIDGIMPDATCAVLKPHLITVMIVTVANVGVPVALTWSPTENPESYYPSRTGLKRLGANLSEEIAGRGQGTVSQSEQSRGLEMLPPESKEILVSVCASAQAPITGGQRRLMPRGRPSRSVFSCHLRL